MLHSASKITEKLVLTQVKGSKSLEKCYGERKRPDRELVVSECQVLETRHATNITGNIFQTVVLQAQVLHVWASKNLQIIIFSS